MLSLPLLVSGALYAFVLGVASQAAPYAQCGGTGFEGPTICTPGWTCVPVAAPLYYQCAQVSSSLTSTMKTSTTKTAKTSTTKTTKTSTTKTSTTKTSKTSTRTPAPTSSIKPTTTSSTTSPLAAGWGQCGGQGFTGPTTCVPGWVCTPEILPFYWQCRQISSSSTTSTTPATMTT